MPPATNPAASPVAGRGLRLTKLVTPSCMRLTEPEGYFEMGEPCLSADNVAAHLGVTKDTVCSWILQGRCQPTRLAPWKCKAAKSISGSGPAAPRSLTRRAPRLTHACP